MKTLLALLILGSIISVTACSQKMDASKVPAAVKASFSKNFPDAAATWEKEDGLFEAGFIYNKNEMSALFDADGTLTESEMIIAPAELPAVILTYLRNNHKGAGIREAAKITKATGEMLYEAEIKGKDLLFDINGNFIRAVKK